MPAAFGSRPGIETIPLSLWSLPMRAKINGLEMTYAVSGPAHGPAVVLHHPLATSMSFWDEATAALEGTYRVIRFDARGHGASEAPVGPYDFKMLAGDVVGLMDLLGIKRAQFVGLSMGGMIAQTLGLHHGGRFSSLTIASSSSKTADGMRHLWAERVATTREKGMISQVEPALQRWLAASARAGRPDLVARCSAMITATPLEGYIGWCGAIETLNFTEQLGAIKVPTLVVVGAEDPATPIAASETIQRAIPGAELAIIPAVSHMLAIENPAAFHAVLLPFLAKHAV
jgi:3-oxoadipate enol-lactonase